MLIVDVVLETFDPTGFDLWPVADLPAYRFLPLSGHMSPHEIGTAMGTLTEYKRISTDDPPAADGVEQVRTMIEAELVIANGGLRIKESTTGAEITPGCCCGLEDWRDWLDLRSADELWLGHHDLPPRIEHAGSLIRLWPGGGTATSSGQLPVEIPLADLPEMLRTAQDKLCGFLSLTERWARQHAPALASSLILKLDEDLMITATL